MTNEVQYAEQNQQGLGALVVPALIIGGVVLFARSRGGLGGGGGNGNGAGEGNGAGPGEDVPAGMANVGGHISEVLVSQGAEMGQIDKVVGASITVSMSFVNGTRKDGVAIEWPYYLIVRIGHSTVFGWKDATQLRQNFRDQSGNVVRFPWPSIQFNTLTRTTTRMPVMTVPSDEGQNYDIHVQLRGQESDSFGKPNGVWMNLGDEVQERNAFKITQAESNSTVSGFISNVSVAQDGPGERIPEPSNRRGLRLTGRS